MLTTKPIDLRPDLAEIIHKILKDNLEEGTYVFAFGSRANWTAKQSSDLDLAIDSFGEKLDRKVKSNLEDAFEESNLPYTVDVVDYNFISDSFREAIKDDLVRVLWDWSTSQLKDIVLLNPNNVSSKDIYDTYLYLDTSSITENHIDIIHRFSKKEDLPSRAKRKVNNLDIVYSCVRPIQKHFGIIKSSTKNLLVSTGFTVIRCEQGILNPLFLYYYLSQDHLINYLQGIAEHSTSAYPSIKPSDIGALNINLPPLSEQKRIAEILSSLDNKIEINKQINQTLEEMAQALFKSWFIDFDPVKAKKTVLKSGGSEEEANYVAMKVISSKTDEELEQFKNSNFKEYQELEETAKLFPSEFQDSELEEIPLGWEIKSLKDITQITTRGIAPKYVDSNGITVINQKCIRNNLIDFNLTKLHKPLDKPHPKELQVEDLLINSTGVGTLGRVAIVRYLNERTIFDTHVTLVRADNDQVTSPYLNSYLVSQEQYITSLGSGSTGQIELRRQSLEEMQITLPTRALMHSFNKQYYSFNEQIVSNLLNGLYSFDLRDSLMQKLVNGDLVIDNLTQKEISKSVINSVI